MPPTPTSPPPLAAPSIGFALVAAVLIGGGITGGAVNPDRALGPAIMSGTFTSVGFYVIAELLGGVAAALRYANVIAKATAPTMERGDPQAGQSAGDRGLATGNDTATGGSDDDSRADVPAGDRQLATGGDIPPSSADR